MNRRSAVNRSDVLWNMAGTTASALASLLLVMGATRIAGPDVGGVFSIAFATAQLLMMAGNYGLRTFQVSDQHEQFTLREYVLNRLCTCALMPLLAIGYCLVGGFDAAKSTVVVLVVASRMMDAFADVFEGRLQQRNHLAVAGRSLTLRMLATTAVFLLTLLITGQLVTACAAMLLTSCLCVLLAAVLPQRRLAPAQHHTLRTRQAVALLGVGFPLFFSAFGLQYIASTPKYAIDALMDAASQSYFSILYMPAQITSLLATFVFKPLIVDMTLQWNDGEHAALMRTVHRLLAYIAAAVTLVAAGCALLGIPILQLLSGLDLQGHFGTLMLLVCSGAFTAAAGLLMQTLTVMRKHLWGFGVYAAVMAMSTVLSRALVGRLGLTGAAAALPMQMAVLAVALYAVLRICMRRSRA